MTQLLTRNQQTATHLEDLSAQVQAIQEQLNLLNQEIRVSNQRHKAQESLAKEWQASLTAMTKIFKDACSVYGDPVALQDMVQDVQATVATVTTDFDKYAQSDRFLNQETAQDQDEDENTLSSPQPLELVESLPDENDDEIILSESQLTRILRDEPDEIVHNLRDLAKLNGNLKRRKSIIKAIADRNITYLKLSKAIELARQNNILLFAS